MAHMIVKVNKLLQKQVVDEVDVFVVGEVHLFFLSMIIHTMIRGVLQVQRIVYFQYVNGWSAGAVNPLLLLDNLHRFPS